MSFTFYDLQRQVERGDIILTAIPGGVRLTTLSGIADLVPDPLEVDDIEVAAAIYRRRTGEDPAAVDSGEPANVVQLRRRKKDGAT